MTEKEDFKKSLGDILTALAVDQPASDLTIMLKEFMYHYMSGRTSDIKSFLNPDQVWHMQYNFSQAMKLICKENSVDPLILKLDRAERIIGQTTAAIFGGACSMDRARGITKAYITRVESWPEERPYHLPPSGSLEAWMLHASRCFSGPRGYHKIDPDPLGLRLLIEEGLIKPEHYIDPTKYSIY